MMAIQAWQTNALMGPFTDALRGPLTASAIQFSGQLACNSFSQEQFFRQNFLAVQSQAQLLASAMGIGVQPPANPVAFQPFIPTTFVSAGAGSHCSLGPTFGATSSAGGSQAFQ
jgi:hypothetical protein